MTRASLITVAIIPMLIGLKTTVRAEAPDKKSAEPLRQLASEAHRMEQNA